MKKLIMITLAVALMGCDAKPKPIPRRPVWTKSTKKVVVEKAGMESVTKVVKTVKKTNAKVYRPGEKLGNWFSRYHVILKGATKTRVEFTALVQNQNHRMSGDRAYGYASATSFEYYFTAPDTSKPFKIRNFTAQVVGNKLYIKPTENGDFKDGFSLVE